METLALPSMIASGLVVGGEFRTTPRQRKNFMISKIIMLSQDINPPEYRGKLLIIVANCKQILLSPETEVFPAI